MSDTSASVKETPPESNSMQDLARASLRRGREKCQTHDYDAAEELAKKVLGLLAPDRSSEAQLLRAECFELQADVLVGKRELPEALNRYEQCLTARSRFEDRTSEGCMNLLFKIERTIGALSILEADSEADYQNRWRSTLLLSAEMRLSENAGANADRSTVEIDKKKLDKLRDGVLDQLERKKKASRFKKDVLSDFVRVCFDVTWAAMPFILLVIMAGTCWLVFTTATTRGVSVRDQINTLTRGKPTTSQMTESVANNSGAILDNAQLPTSATTHSRRDYTALHNPIHVLTDFDNTAEIKTPKTVKEVPLLIDSLTNMPQIWWASLSRRNEWFRAAEYGLLDSRGDFYLDNASRESRLARELLTLANHGGGGSYYNPFSNKIEATRQIASTGSNLDSAMQKALSASFWKGSLPGTAFELRAGSGNSHRVAEFGVDGKGNLMPIALVTGNKPPALGNISGVIISGQNRFSIYILIGSSAIIAACCWLLSAKLGRPRTKFLLFMFSVAFTAVAIRAILNIW